MEAAVLDPAAWAAAWNSLHPETRVAAYVLLGLFLIGLWLKWWPWRKTNV